MPERGVGIVARVAPTTSTVLEERLGEGAAIDGHERTIGPAARRMNGARDQLFADARLALDDKKSDGSENSATAETEGVPGRTAHVSRASG
jgi:hypothetical protein